MDVDELFGKAKKAKAKPGKPPQPRTADALAAIRKAATFANGLGRPAPGKTSAERAREALDRFEREKKT